MDFRTFTRVDAVSNLDVRLLDHSDGVRALRTGVDAATSDLGADFPLHFFQFDRALLFSHLQFALFEDLEDDDVDVGRVEGLEEVGGG